MNTNSSTASRSWNEQPVIAISIAVALYCVYYFIFCKLPIIGTPTFRIDYFATTVTRADDGLMQSLFHSRPISELYVYIQAILAKYFLDGQTKYIIYPFQHAALLVYFFSISKVIESIFKIRVHTLTFLAAWVLFITSPGLIGDVYKLETIVGTVSMLFGGLALVVLSRWERNRTHSAAIVFVSFYAFSIFAKEDFILPPLFLLSWYLFKDGEWKQQIIDHKWLLSSVVLLLIFFVIFNKFIIPGRSFMEPADKAKSPYFMTLNPISMAKVAYYYFAEEGRHIRVLSLFYAIATLIALALGKKWKETLLIALMVAGLMAPYLIMPNHKFSYYAVKWWAWQAIASLILIQIIFAKREAVVTALISVIVLTPALINLGLHRGTTWNQSAYFRDRFAKSGNVQRTLLVNRNAINAQKRVAVVGIGPGEIEQSPWQGNGETGHFLRGDLDLDPKWIVFVKSADASYVVTDNMQTDVSQAPEIAVKNISEIGLYKNLPRLVFGPDGNGEFIEHQPADNLEN
jgi:hypothetical protein